MTELSSPSFLSYTPWCVHVCALCIKSPESIMVSKRKLPYIDTDDVAWLSCKMRDKLPAEFHKIDPYIMSEALRALHYSGFFLIAVFCWVKQGGFKLTGLSLCFFMLTLLCTHDFFCTDDTMCVTNASRNREYDSTIYCGCVLCEMCSISLYQIF